MKTIGRGKWIKRDAGGYFRSSGRGKPLWDDL